MEKYNKEEQTKKAAKRLEAYDNALKKMSKNEESASNDNKPGAKQHE